MGYSATTPCSSAAPISWPSAAATPRCWSWSGTCNGRRSPKARPRTRRSDQHARDSGNRAVSRQEPSPKFDRAAAAVKQGGGDQAGVEIIMPWQRRLAVLFVMLALAGCAPVAGGPDQVPRSLSTERHSRHQRYALTRSPADRRARAAAGFRLNLAKPTDRRTSHAPPSAARILTFGDRVEMGTETGRFGPRRGSRGPQSTSRFWRLRCQYSSPGDFVTCLTGRVILGSSWRTSG